MSASLLLQEVLCELRAIHSLLATKPTLTRLTREQAASSLNISLSSFDLMVRRGQISRDQDTGPLRFRSADIEAIKAVPCAVVRRKRKAVLA